MFARRVVLSVLIATLPLAGCDLLGIQSASKVAEARDADGRAIGSACRHSNRALEDCFALNRKADRAAILAGWRDMNDYMRENRIEPVTPQLARGARTAPANAPTDGEMTDVPSPDARTAAGQVTDSPTPSGS